ncbi:MAG: M48 family metallopeptidase [Spirochaetes bacterium]|nr:M48 family metallopeptidase [Spirochaetota bacterium]
MKRLISLVLIFLFGLVILFFVVKEKTKTPYDITLAPLYQALGIPFKTADRLISRAVPVDALDEKKFGIALKNHYRQSTNLDDQDYLYVNQVMASLSKHKRKPFDYEVFVLNYSYPNAFALPGGAIIVTNELLNILESESELVSILAHEMGHIELSHCFDLVRFELLSRKISSKNTGWLIDFTIGLFFNYAFRFSTTIENEADDYGYQLLLKTNYDPHGSGLAFSRLREYQSKYYSETTDTQLFKDYFLSHPPLKIREEKYTEMAKAWWKLHSRQKRYIGKINLKKRVSFTNKDFGLTEWRDNGK